MKAIRSIGILLIWKLGIATGLCGPEPYVSDKNTELLYHVDETTGTVAVDSSGRGRNGTFGTGLTIAEPAMPLFLKSFQPNLGLTNRLYWTHNAAGTGSFLYPKATADFTVEGWFKLITTSLPSNRVLFAVQPSGSATLDYQLVVMAETDPLRGLGLVFRDSTGTYLAYTGTLQWDIAKWYHVAVTVKNNASNATYSIYRTPEGGASPQLVATRTGARIVPAASTADRVISVGNFYGNWGVDYFPGYVDEFRYSNIARTAADLQTTVAPSIYDQIRREALALNNETDHALPLLSGWNSGIYSYLYNRPDDFGYSPAWQMPVIANNHHLLPWFTMPTPDVKTSSGDYAKYLRYYELPLKEAALRNLPISFVGPSWEHYLNTDPIYRNGVGAQNPNVTYTTTGTDGVVTTHVVISPMSLISQWEEVGNRWATSPLMQKVQEWYPTPPSIVYISDNEAAKLKYQFSGSDSRYTTAHGTTQDDDAKRETFGNNWITRYRALQVSWKNALTPTWKERSIYVAYGGFTAFFGRIDHWQSATLTIPNRLSPDPLAWDGGLADNYLTSAYTYNADYQVFSPQVEAMNLEFLRREALTQNPSYWFELGAWNGGDYSAPWTGLEDDTATKKLRRFNPKFVELPETGPDPLLAQTPDPYVAQRYGGMVQFSMWITRPRVVRDYRAWSTARNDTDGVAPYQGSSQPYFDSLMSAVDKVYTSDILRRFWRNSELVANPARLHPYQQAIPAEYASAPRMFMLNTSLDPTGIWALKTQLRLYVLARKRGTAPSREWLLYAFAPAEPNRASVAAIVTIPDYGNVPVTATQSGAFYHVKEATGTVIPLQ